MTQKDVITDYRRTKNMKVTAENLGVSYQVVKKVLITAGLYTSPTIERIRELAALGMDIEKIAETLHMSTSGVCANMSYTRRLSLDRSKTVNAVRIAQCRARKKLERENQPKST